MRTRLATRGRRSMSRPFRVTYLEGVTLNGTDLVGVGRGGCLPDLANPETCYGAASGRPSRPGTRGRPRSAGPRDGHRYTDRWTEGDLRCRNWTGRPGRHRSRLQPATFRMRRRPLPVGSCRRGARPTAERGSASTSTFGPSAFDPFSDPIAAISAGPDGYVMVGHAVDYAASGPNPPAPATAWASRDGVRPGPERPTPTTWMWDRASIRARLPTAAA